MGGTFRKLAKDGWVLFFATLIFAYQALHVCVRVRMHTYISGMHTWHALLD